MSDADTHTHTQLQSSESQLFEDIINSPAALLILTGAGQGEVFTLNQELMTGGRLPENEIHVDDPQMSRRHFQILHDGMAYVLRDVHSTNGTFLNERKVETNTALINGDVIRVGQTRMKFISGNDPELQTLDQYYQRSPVDELTGCYTKDYFNSQLGRIFQRAKENEQPLSLLLFSIEGLRAINVDYGDLAFEYVLTKSIERIKSHGMRSDDMLVRFSEHEFILLLEGAPIKQAKRIAERLLELFEDRPFKYLNHFLRVSLAIGVAELKPEMENANDLFNQADYGLYESKKRGGNRYTVFGAAHFGTVDQDTNPQRTQ